MHSEKTSHDTAGCTCSELPAGSRSDEFLYLLLEEAEVKTYDYQHYAQDHPHCPTLDPVKQADRYGRKDDECCDYRLRYDKTKN
jgi:hypothetical protein